MSESYIKAEIVRPKWTGEEWVANIVGGLLGLALRTLIVWWLFATWFPHFGLTYWQLALPVFAIRTVLANAPFGRQLK